MVQKCNEIYINLKELQGEVGKGYYEKQQFSYLDSIKDVQRKIKEYLKDFEMREVK